MEFGERFHVLQCAVFDLRNIAASATTCKLIVEAKRANPKTFAGVLIAVEGLTIFNEIDTTDRARCEGAISARGLLFPVELRHVRSPSPRATVETWRYGREQPPTACRRCHLGCAARRHARFQLGSRTAEPAMRRSPTPGHCRRSGYRPWYSAGKFRRDGRPRSNRWCMCNAAPRSRSRKSQQAGGWAAAHVPWYMPPARKYLLSRSGISGSPARTLAQIARHAQLQKQATSSLPPSTRTSSEGGDDTTASQWKQCERKSSSDSLGGMVVSFARWPALERAGAETREWVARCLRRSVPIATARPAG